MLVIGALYSAPALSTQQTGVGIIVCMSTYIFGFNIGLEGYGYLTAGELAAQNLRAYPWGYQ